MTYLPCIAYQLPHKYAMHARAPASERASGATVRHEFHGLMSSYWMCARPGPGQGTPVAAAPNPNALPKHAFLPPSLTPSLIFSCPFFIVSSIPPQN